MVVNGFALPAAFVQLCTAIHRGEAPQEWELKEDVEAYGQPWRVPDLRFECNPKEMQYWTERISDAFLHGDGYQDPGLIQDFTGVADFVRFVHATDGMFYAFDFGTDPKEPSVVVWQDGYWRRVAPNFKAFMALFVPVGEGPDRSEEDAPPQPGDEGWEAARPTSRTLLARWTLEYVLRRQGYRPFFEDLASDHAGCSAEERREVEAEVREELERMGMTDEQRRTHDELWARLHATHRSN